MEHRWVLLRGLARESGHWGDFVDEFQKRFPADRVITADLPGAGEFRHTKCPMNMTDIWRFVRDQVNMEEGPIRLLAVSLGAMIGMEWLRSAPEDLELCVLVNSSTRSSGPFYRRLRWQVWQDLARLFAITKPRERERAVMEVIMNNSAAREKALPLWTKLALERPISTQNMLLQLAAAASFKGIESLPKSSHVLLLAGLGDRLVDPSNSTALAKKWDCPIQYHPWGGHDLSWDDPSWCLKTIGDWVDRI